MIRAELPSAFRKRRGFRRRRVQFMYINGTAISTLTQLTANASTGFTIGTVNYYGSFLGEIGELLIFNNALSTSDISTIYSAR